MKVLIKTDNELPIPEGYLIDPKTGRGLKQRITKGIILQIPLFDGTYGYGQYLDCYTVFFDYRTETKDGYDIQAILKSPVLFKLAVFDFAIKKCWPIIGKTAYDPALDEFQKRYWYNDLIDKLFLQIGEKANDFVESTWEECQHYECREVWGPYSVEERLLDHFLGRPCYAVEMGKPPFIRDKNFPIPDYPRFREVKKEVEERRKREAPGQKPEDRQ